RSSRRLEAETHRNLEVIWLMRKLRPGHKTIAEFRRVHGKALKQVTRSFLLICQELELLDGTLVLIDGTKLRAQNSPQRTYTASSTARLLRQVEASIAQYLAELDRQDRQEEGMRGPTDPDSRLMKVGGGMEVCYNVQIALDFKHALIVAHEVTNAGNDQRQLAPMARAAQEALGVEHLEVAADSGYHSPAQIAACEASGITPYVPEPLTSNSAKAGLFTKE